MNTRKLWIPKRPEVKKQCASCPFKKGNDTQFKSVIVSLRKQAGEKKPVTKLDIVTARMRIEDDVEFIGGDFSCHATVYGPDMELKPEKEWKQCSGATKFYRKNGGRK